MQRYRPNTTVACVIHSQGQFLLVEEIINGKHCFNQPAGHLEANESIEQACLREVFEETGLKVTLSGLIKVYQFTAQDGTAFVRFTFAAELAMQQSCVPNDPAIKACHWFSYEQLKQNNLQLRSPLVCQSIDDYLLQADNMPPLSLLSSAFL